MIMKIIMIIMVFSISADPIRPFPSITYYL